MCRQSVVRSSISLAILATQLSSDSASQFDSAGVTALTLTREQRLANDDGQTLASSRDLRFDRVNRSMAKGDFQFPFRFISIIAAFVCVRLMKTAISGCGHCGTGTASEANKNGEMMLRSVEGETMFMDPWNSVIAQVYHPVALFLVGLMSSLVICLLSLVLRFVVRVLRNRAPRLMTGRQNYRRYRNELISSPRHVGFADSVLELDDQDLRLD